jgi:hypothetical protein
MQIRQFCTVRRCEMFLMQMRAFLCGGVMHKYRGFALTRRGMRVRAGV